MEDILSVIILSAIIVVVTAAPTLTEGPAPANSVVSDQEIPREYYRDRRSQYQYMSPCAAAAAAAASSPIPAIAPTAYQVNLSPYNAYAAPHGYYGAPHYRSGDFEPEHEMLSYSDMDHMMSEHMPMARYGYPVPAASHVPAGYAPLVQPATTGPAFGVFPHGNTGGCSVPLLFSCSPSIVQGRAVPTPPNYTYGDSYRGVEPLTHQDSQEHHEDPAVHDHMNAAVHEQTHGNVHQ